MKALLNFFKTRSIASRSISYLYVNTCDLNDFIVVAFGLSQNAELLNIPRSESNQIDT